MTAPPIVFAAFVMQVFASWFPVLAAVLFFVTGALLQRLVMGPIASLVYSQEVKEGAFRFGLARWRMWAEEIALYR